jgi:hypothetical protein
MKELFEFLVAELQSPGEVTIESAIAKLGLRGRILDVNTIQTAPTFSDDTKSMLFIKNAIAVALRCPICGGLLDPNGCN